ncbi:MAG: acyl-CoA dehydrogenase family protein [Acidimicrobiales bacterium]|jgi:alkylation response protein AidB-like acyl-CoA dehydrogenase
MSDADLDDFRLRCRTFLAEHATRIDVSEGDDPRAEKALAAAKQFQGALVEAGLSGLTYPTKYGGQGLSGAHERVWREEAGTFPVMTRQLSISHGMALPMLNEYGSDEQRSTYQAKVIGAEEVWCQMFSEPGAGSDVASLQSRAVLDGDEWILNGQKVWTTLAHVCERGLIIARTDLDQPKHRGISMFILDMNAPGVEIRPIHQIDGGMRFNEVFFTDVRIPADHQIGPINEGWRLATAMLMYERVAIGGGQSLGINHDRADLLIKEAKRRGKLDDSVLRQELMKLYAAEVCQSLLGMQTRAALQAGKTPGPGGSLGKLAGANIAATYRGLSLGVVGVEGVAWESNNRWATEALGTFASGIAGGTDQIQRNIIGERVLGLPREPSVDKDLPFRDLKVGTQVTGSQGQRADV